MRKIVVVRFAEIGLKGKNRKDFEKNLMDNIKNVTGKDVIWKWGRLYVEMDWEKEDVNVFKKIFGIQNYSKGFIVDKNWEDIENATRRIVEMKLNENPKTFKVNAKRIDKSFPMGIYDINRKLGAFILKNYELSVDVHNPDFELGVEIREEGVIVFGEKIKAYGGLPVGVSGKGLLLLSGGIDSPVAGWYMMKRGLSLYALSFISPPYTGVETIRKLRKIVERLNEYSSGKWIKLYFAPLTPVLELIQDNTPKKYHLVIHRRAMMRIAERFAEEKKIPLIITGESIGQVASQTVQNLKVIEETVTLPVVRPLSGFDKVEIVERAREIGTYEISILKHPDVCTIFTPKNPSTSARLEVIKRLEEELGDRLKKAEDEVFCRIERDEYEKAEGPDS